MPVFRIYRMKDAPRQQFRFAPHLSGRAEVKPKDYEPGGEIEAENEYAAWAALRRNALPLGVGDLLEAPDGALRICKFVGWEQACWILPENRNGEIDAHGVPPSEAPSPDHARA